MRLCLLIVCSCTMCAEPDVPGKLDRGESAGLGAGYEQEEVSSVR
jgi:hypothetical protein